MGRLSRTDGAEVKAASPALDVVVSLVTMVVFLATLDLVARAVPPHAAGTFFAGLMSISNLDTTGRRGSEAGPTTSWG